MRGRLLVVAALVTTSTTLAAQECAGIPGGGRGFLALGPSGTDGASGTGFSFAYRRTTAALQASYQSLGVFAYANEQKTRTVQGSLRVKALRGCVTAGAKWQAWNTDRDDNTSWDASRPTIVVEEHTIGGNYDRVRLPVGVSFGRSFQVKRLSIVPYANPHVALELEDFQSTVPNDDAPSQSRRSFGGGLELGAALRVGWFVMRTSVNNTNTADRALSGKRNSADLAMHFGVIF
jgi:hypothetical protein